MNSTHMAPVITVLQHFEKEPLLNIKRTWTYVISFQLLIVFFTTSVYLKDINLILRIKNLNIKPVHTVWLFVATIFLTILDRCFYSLSRSAIGQSDKMMYFKMENILVIMQYSFPIVVLVCFLVLFYKYYNDNIRIG